MKFNRRPAPRSDTIDQKTSDQLRQIELRIRKRRKKRKSVSTIDSSHLYYRASLVLLIIFILSLVALCVSSSSTSRYIRERKDSSGTNDDNNDDDDDDNDDDDITMINDPTNRTMTVVKKLIIRQTSSSGNLDLNSNSRYKSEKSLHRQKIIEMKDKLSLLQLSEHKINQYAIVQHYPGRDVQEPEVRAATRAGSGSERKLNATRMHKDLEVMSPVTNGISSSMAEDSMNLTRAKRLDQEFEEQASDRSSNVVENSTQGEPLSSTTTIMAWLDEYQEQQNMEANLKCRLEKDLYIDFEQYKHRTCTNCYSFIPPDFFIKKLQVSKNKLKFYDSEIETEFWTNETEIIEKTFKFDQTYKKWRECCEKAIECCKGNSIYLPTTKDDNGNLIDDTNQTDFCPATWDGLDCWPNTPAGFVTSHECPIHIYFLQWLPICKGQVSKQCFSNGSWYIRNGHEWSNFSYCGGLNVYEDRMIIGASFYILSAIGIAPGLLILSKMPNRGGTKRVFILKNLLLWLLANALFTALHRFGIVDGIFRFKPIRENTSPFPFVPRDRIIPTTASSLQVAAPLRLARSINLEPTKWLLPSEGSNTIQGQANNSGQLEVSQGSSIGLLLEDENRNRSRRHLLDVKQDNFDVWRRYILAHNPSNDKRNQIIYVNNYNNISEISSNHQLDRNSNISRSHAIRLWYSNDQHEGADEPSERHPYGRPKRSASQGNTGSTSIATSGISSIGSASGWHEKSHNSAVANFYPKQSVILVVLCYTISVGVRITRLFVYAWMFTGAIYLCSVLHYAPAEPPTVFIKWLMIITSAFPIVIGSTYVIVRSIYEPSALNLVYKLPYYYLINDMEYVEYLKTSQSDCWQGESNFESIEKITDTPNLILIILNTTLFCITLFMMCRINRPGSTRPEMSAYDYFRAAGMLVFLYGAHFSFLSFVPKLEGCTTNQVYNFAFIALDSLQGVLIAVVFCYRTPEGREVYYKWWKSCCNKHACVWLNLTNRRHLGADYQNEPFKDHSRSTRSARSSNSVCNGKDLVTELSNVNVNHF